MGSNPTPGTTGTRRSARTRRPLIHAPEILGQLAIAAAIAVILAVFFARLRLPTTIAFLAAGALVGPNGFRLIGESEAITQLAEFGVVMLLFAIGLEFSLGRLAFIWRPVAIGGTVQVALTTTIGFTFLYAVAGDTPSRAFVFAIACALSSTAIVLRALADRDEIDAPHGKFTVGALIFQDILVVPLTMIVPALSPNSDSNPVMEAGIAVAKAAVAVAVTVLLARIAMPRLFREVDRTHSRELFLLAVLGAGLGSAWMMSEFGLSLALGAFLAGVVLADTDYSERAITDVLPIRDALTSIFFVSLGMLFDPRVFIDEPIIALAIVVALVFGKWITGSLAAIATGFAARASWLGGIYLSQFGEFGFVILTLGAAAGLVTADETRLIVTTGVASMVISRSLMSLAPRLHAGEIMLRPLERILRARGIDDPRRQERDLGNHVIVVGFGVAGELIARTMRPAGVRFIILELNADRVRRGRAHGYPIYYGDITSLEAQRHAHITQARAIVLVINDPDAARRAIAATRSINPEIPIICRTRYVRDRDSLIALGASEVVCEELEGATEMAAQVLIRCGLTADDSRPLLIEALEDLGHASFSRRRDEWITALSHDRDHPEFEQRSE
ncbi:MAG: cation:proton antiporter [Chloroflexi bacterium]|nr:cation:proton antiporter [Chloroflexota bacterium]